MFRIFSTRYSARPEIIRQRCRNRTLGHRRFACRAECVCGNGDAYATAVGTAGQEGLNQEIRNSNVTLTIR
jgi:hypothetical protein